MLDAKIAHIWTIARSLALFLHIFSEFFSVCGDDVWRVRAVRYFCNASILFFLTIIKLLATRQQPKQHQHYLATIFWYICSSDV